MTSPDFATALMTDDGAQAAQRDWLALIGGDAGLDRLSHRLLDGIAVPPLAPRDRSGELSTSRSGWASCGFHAGATAGAVRAAIAEDIAGGVQSVALKLATPGDFGLPPRFDAIGAALQGVALETLEVSLLPGDQYFGAAQSLMALWDLTGRPPQDMRAGVLADPLGALARTGVLEAGLWPSLELLGQFVAANTAAWPHVRMLLADGALYHDAGASEAQELAAMLATVVEYLRVMEFDGLAPAGIFPHLTVTLAADASVFATIAKLRAARLLLARLCQAVGAGHAQGAIRMWVVTSQRMLTVRARHGNVLRNSLAALAAAAGGADVITVLPGEWGAGAPSAASRRLARNTLHILAQESGFARVADPAAGAGSISGLTRAMAARAWTLFQEIEADGGMAKALLSGKVQEGILDMAARREKLVEDGKLAILGVTAYAALDNDPPVPQHPPVAPIERAQTHVTPLAVRPLSSKFEPATFAGKPMP